jgi:AP-1 complex subunit gamma-1
MESLALIASGNYPEKRIGYLGLMILLDETAQVLMLVTNTLKTDFQHKNPYIIGLALASLGNICNADMARDLANEVEKFFRHANAYIRKKAALCAIRIIRKVPELIEEFINSVQNLLNDKNHAVLLTAVTLIIEMTTIDPSTIAQLRKITPTVVRLLKNLVLAGYVSEYDVVGITDPFLQSKLVHLLRVLGRGDRETSELMNDILAQVAINTEPTKNPGNAILYETVQTIMSIEAESGLRVLAINILGRFLTNRDNNIRYVALNTLCKVVSRDTQAIQRHRNTVVDCLKDCDISIRRRALDLIYALVTKNNVKALVKELLNYLGLTSGDSEFKTDLTEKICLVVDKFAPSKHWQIDTIIAVLQSAGPYAQESVHTDLILLITRTPNLQPYSIYKLWQAAATAVKAIHSALLNVILYCLGELGDLLINPAGLEKAQKVDSEANFTLIDESEILDFLEKTINSTPNLSLLTQEYFLNTAMKLIARVNKSPSKQRLNDLIQRYSTSMQVELQQRAAEYSVLTDDKLAKIRSGVLQRMPVPARKAKKSREEESKEKSTRNKDDEESSSSEPEDEESEDEATELDLEEKSEDREAAVAIPKPTNGVKKQPTPKRHDTNLFDLDVFGSVPTLPSDGNSNADKSTPAPKTGGELDFLSDLLDSANISSNNNSAPVTNKPAAAGNNDLLDLFGTSKPAATSPNTQNKPAVASPLAANSNNNVLSNDIFAALGAGNNATVSSPTASTSPGNYPPAVVFQSNGLSVTFNYSRSPSTPALLNIVASFSNSTTSDFTHFEFQVAVLKHVQLTMQPASSNIIPAQSNNSVTQKLLLNNTMHGAKKLAIRVKIDYQTNGQNKSEQTQISAFPE